MKTLREDGKGARNCDVKMIVKLRPGNNMLTTTIIPGVSSSPSGSEGGETGSDSNFD